MGKRQFSPIDRRNLLAFAGFGLGLGASAAQGATAETPPWSDRPTGDFYATVDDLRVFCRKAGNGPLIIVQSGMWVDSLDDTMAGPFAKVLAQHFTVLVFDARGQGRTNLGRGRISYGRFAFDTVRLMDVLGIDRAHFFGHSDGGCIGLHLLLDFPDRITTATLCGTVYDHDGYNAESRNFFTNAFEDMKKGGTAFPDSEFVNHKEKYAKNSPNPEKLLEVLIGQRDCWVSEPNFNARQLSRIHTPVLVIDAGRDQYLDPAHFKVLADAIPTAHRVCYPEMTHDFASYYEVIAKEVAQIAAAPRTARGIQDTPTNSTRLRR